MEKLCTPWKGVLVVKLLGKKLGFNIMKSKLEKVWDIHGGMELMHIGNSLFTVKFDSVEDKVKVISE